MEGKGDRGGLARRWAGAREWCLEVGVGAAWAGCRTWLGWEWGRRAEGHWGYAVVTHCVEMRGHGWARTMLGP